METHRFVTGAASEELPLMYTTTCSCGWKFESEFPEEHEQAVAEHKEQVIIAKVGLRFET